MISNVLNTLALSLNSIYQGQQVYLSLTSQKIRI